MNFNQIINLIAQDMTNVNTTICNQLKSKASLINKIGRYIINGGKRIRPIIVILTAKALHYRGTKHITIAALIECIHTATLLHDDVIDKSSMRRGKTTANIEFGNAASVLVGDFIYTRAFQMITTLESMQILKLVSETVNIIAEGEVLQLMNSNNPNTSIKNYMHIIYSKTAKLFETASQTSAILSGANFYQELALRNYGRYLGTAFQLIDDTMDYEANKKTLGKKTGNDLNEGKLTMPLLHAMKHGTPQQTSLIRKTIKYGNKRHLLKNILKVMYQYNSLEFTRQYAKKEINKAIDCLKCLTPSPYRDALQEIAELIIKHNI